MTISTDEVAKRLVFLRSNPSCARKAVYKREIISARAKHALHALMTREQQLFGCAVMELERTVMNRLVCCR